MLDHLDHSGGVRAAGDAHYYDNVADIAPPAFPQHITHQALVHTAAASNLGQMLHRICQRDGMPLVNIVRKPEQVTLLRSMGAQHVYDMNSPSFREELTDALEATAATLVFDAVGGRLVGRILSCMEAAINRKAVAYSRYGSTTLKQAYIYGGLDGGATEIVRNFGATWSIGGWLLLPCLQKIGTDAVQALKDQVAAELRTTFQSRYAGELSLVEVLQPDNIARYARRSTGGKYLILPNKGLD